MNWEALVAGSQSVIYLAVALAIGGFFSDWLCRVAVSELQKRTSLWHSRLVYSAVALGCLFVVIGYFGFIASINQAGWRGGLDFELMRFLVADPPTVTAISQFALLLSLGLLWRWRRSRFIGIVYVTLSVLLALSFTLRGHVANAPIGIQIILVLHVLAMSMWAGSLLPLWLLVRQSTAINIRHVLERFGRLAQGFVAVLLASGLFMLLYLLESPFDLLYTSYGNLLILKFFAVLLLLVLAATNKLRLVPNVQQSPSRNWLARSIKAEMLLVVVIFSLTAVLTVILGHS